MRTFVSRRTASMYVFFFFSSRRRHTRFDCDWSSDVCSSDLGWWATLGQYWADGSAAHRQAARSYLDLDGLRGQYLSGVQDPSLIDPDNWVIDKALIDRPAVDEIMLDLLYDIPNQAPVFKAVQEFLRDQ